MTHNNKNTTIVLAFAVIMMALPFATAPNAHAVDLVIPGTCGITVVGGSGGIDIGTVTSGVDSTESLTITVQTDGSLPGTFEISATDWISPGTSATAFLTLTSVVDTDDVVINGETFTATAATQDNNNFVTGGTDVISATNLATAINANPTVAVTALATEEVILLRTDAVGNAANAIGITDSANIVSNAATFTGAAAAGAVIIQSEITRYSVTNTGADPGVTTYAAKTSLDIAGQNDIIVPFIDVAQDILLRFQVTGTLDDAAYIGAITQDLTFDANCI